MLLIFLSSGLFLGWSLGANDAANVFGSAVGTRMVRFRTAAIVCGLFVILGSVIGGGGTSHTLGVLGSVNAIAGSFIVAFSAGFTVFWMTRSRIPVSTSQAIVGAIIGWNLFTNSPTDLASLQKIVFTWVFCPVLSAIIAIILYLTFKTIFNHIRIHLLRRDALLRTGLLLVGAFGAYSLGSNNIANVMGVFVPVQPFDDLQILNGIYLTGTQQLFFIGGLAIALGVYTYSRKVMETVGGSLLKLSPETALIVVFSHSLVLFFFASQELEHWLLSNGLPAFPLVPVSSSQAIVGAILGIGIINSCRSLKVKAFGQIASGWVITPIAACIITFISLFFMQNVFGQIVSKKTVFELNKDVILYLSQQGIGTEQLTDLVGKRYENSTKFRAELTQRTQLSESDQKYVFESAMRDSLYINQQIIARNIDDNWLTKKQIDALKSLEKQGFVYSWQLLSQLELKTDEWKYLPDNQLNKIYNKELKAKREYIIRAFRVEE
jgi:PiT family inorganic phosphate transporter